MMIKAATVVTKRVQQRLLDSNPNNVFKTTIKRPFMSYSAQKKISASLQIYSANL